MKIADIMHLVIDFSFHTFSPFSMKGLIKKEAYFIMKRWFFAGAASSILAVGVLVTTPAIAKSEPVLASVDWVVSQIEPLEERINELEERVDELEGDVEDLQEEQNN